MIAITAISKYYKHVRTGDEQFQQVDCLPSMHRDPGFNPHKLGVMEGVAKPACNPSTLQRWEHKFKVILGYTA